MLVQTCAGWGSDVLKLICRSQETVRHTVAFMNVKSINSDLHAQFADRLAGRLDVCSLSRQDHCRGPQAQTGGSDSLNEGFQPQGERKQIW